MNKKRKEIVEVRKEREYVSDVLTKAANLVKKLPEGEQKEKLISLLRSYLINNGCSLLITPEYPIPAEHKLLIRDDCNGNISSISSSLLSESYLSALKKTNPKMLPLGNYENALNNSIYAREMAQYPSYNSVRRSILIHLIRERVHPEVIEKMNVADFRSFVHDYCYDDFTAYHKKKGFVKVFINSNEQEFYRLLCDNGVHPVYAEQLIRNMQEKGSAAAFKMEYKGQIITGPGLNTDHKDAVYCPSDIKSYPEVNAPEKLNLLEENMHILKHLLERPIVNADGMRMYEKIMMPKYCVAALDFEHKLYFDFDNPEHKVVPQRPNVDNHILINKIETLVNSISLTNTAVKSKSNRKYFNKNGRNDGSRR